MSMHVQANFPPLLDLEECDVEADLQQDVATYGIAGRVWDAAILLDKYLSPTSDGFSPPCPLFDLPSAVILELGSGTGYTGLMLSRRLAPAASLVLTDLPEVCAGILSKNATLDARLCVKPLEWGNRGHLSCILSAQPHIDLILVADCVYFPFLFQPLLDTLIGLSDACPALTMIIAHKIRNLPVEQTFWAMFGRHFEYEPVWHRTTATDRMSRYGIEDGAFVFVARKRVSPLSGPDDTFERLLMANIDIS